MYICSKECQIQQFFAGHKDHCRRKGDIRAGDYMVIWDLEKSPSLNGEIVQVEGPDGNQPGRWAVRQPGFEKTMSISSKKLFRLRPLK